MGRAKMIPPCSEKFIRNIRRHYRLYSPGGIHLYG
jgi:hypothetical protein